MIPADALRPARQRSIVLLVVLLVMAVSAGCSAGAGAATTSVRILGSAPETWDPALQGDQGTATTLAQVSETLTAIDAAGNLQPALAASWTVAPDGLSVAFRLRPDLVFSDGTPLAAADVVRSWLRLLDPSHRAPLVSLLDDVVGVREYQAGTGSLNAVGIEATADDVVTVTFRSGGAYFPSAAASPSLAVVPATIDAAYDSPSLPANFVGSGAYLPVREDGSSIRLEANPHYWAGAPAIPTIELITDTAGKPSYQAFEDGDVDYAPVDDYAASWIRSEAVLGPQLVEVPNPAVLYYGFDTRHPPFADVRVRKAFAEAVDWRHLVELGSPFDTPATSLVPPGIAGRASGDYGATYDPVAARADLAAAGFPGGQGFPTVTLDTGGLPFDAALAREWQQQLGVSVRVEALTDGYFERLTADPPQIWALDWVADYPAAQDFLGLLLTTGASNNYGGWSNSDFDREVRAGAATADPAAQVGHFEMAERIVQDQAPIVPLSYGRAWALVRAGLRGAGASTLSILRFAGLAWGQP